MESRYSRQLLLPEIGQDGQEKLRQSRVAIVGVGGLGSPIATYLAGAGVGTLGLFDDDTVSLSNLHRQVLYCEQQEGQPKVSCAAQRLRMQNSEVRIEEHRMKLNPENSDSLLAPYDIVVDGTDNFSARYAISDTCQRMHKPYVYGAINALEGQVAVLCVGRTTYRTLFPDEHETLSMPHPGKAVVGGTPGVVGCVEATQVLQLLCGFGEPLIDRLWTIDLRSMHSFIINL